MSTQKLPLEGVRVVDFTAIWAGPHVTQWLAVMGADVIKIESNIRPDAERAAFIRTTTEPTMSAVFAALNYAKKACTLNMTNPKGRDLAREIIKVSDVVAENFGGAVMDRWGLGYPELKRLKSDIILYSGSGFGRTGPYSELPAFAGIVEALGGMCLLNGYLGSEPLPMATRGYADLTSAQHGAYAILAALYHRSKTGEGQHIDLSMTEVVGALLPEAIMDYTMNDRVPRPQGNRDVAMAPHGCYRCQGDDEWVAIAISNDEEWRAFCNAMGNPEWTNEDRFRDGLSRWKNQEELDQLVGEWTGNRTRFEATDILQKAGVMAGPSLKVEDVAHDPHLAERGFFVELDQPGIGVLPMAGLPWKVVDGPRGDYEHSPALGEHNDYVFKELLKMSDEEMARLQEEEAIL